MRPTEIKIHRSRLSTRYFVDCYNDAHNREFLESCKPFPFRFCTQEPRFRISSHLEYPDGKLKGPDFVEEDWPRSQSTARVASVPCCNGQKFNLQMGHARIVLVTVNSSLLVIIRSA